MHKNKNGILMIAVLILVALPFIFLQSEFAGADTEALTVIETIAPNYTPWIENFFSPPGGEMESFLFSMQAAIGAAILGYVFGFFKGKGHVKSN